MSHRNDTETQSFVEWAGYCLMRNDCKLDAWGDYEFL